MTSCFRMILIYFSFFFHSMASSFGYKTDPSSGALQVTPFMGLRYGVSTQFHLFHLLSHNHFLLLLRRCSVIELKDRGVRHVRNRRTNSCSLLGFWLLSVSVWMCQKMEICGVGGVRFKNNRMTSLTGNNQSFLAMKYIRLPALITPSIDLLSAIY